MPITNQEISDQLTRFADLLEIEGANPFRVRAYRRAAETLIQLPHAVHDLLREKQPLTQFEGIGPDLSEKIQTLVETNSLPQLAELEKRVPSSLLALLSLPGLGPRKVRLLQQAKILTLEQLQTAAQNHKLQALDGFGPKTEEQLLIAIEKKLNAPSRRLLSQVEGIEATLVAYLRNVRGVGQVQAAGSYRRRKETVGDLDILAEGPANSGLMDHFLKYDMIDQVLAQGETKASVRLKDGLQVDLRLVPEESFGAALLYFTGSQAHGIALRKLALAKELKLNEYGLYQGKKRLAGTTEGEMYRALGLPFIEPELREDQGELDAALNGTLPRLIKLEDLRGDLHSHTSATDGNATLAEMAQAARERGLEYLGITDHSQSLTVARGLDPKRVIEQIRQIDELNAKLEGLTLLKGMEVDILEDGQLDLPDAVLRELDYTICSIHSKFKLSAKQQTQRVLKAMENRAFSILGHPTGRLLNEREPYALDMEKVIAAAQQYGVALELSAEPSRLDLNETHCRWAKAAKVLVSINTDAHSPWGLDHLRFGVGQARRGWLEPNDVLNTLPLAALRKRLKRR